VQNTIAFNPPLPPWKQDVIARLGYGLLNKVVLCFPNVFWDGLEAETFGFAGAGLVGEFYMFWNFAHSTGQPTLVALNSGNAAIVRFPRCVGHHVSVAPTISGFCSGL
jgi:lysine-specific histone demethylase 1